MKIQYENNLPVLVAQVWKDEIIKGMVNTSQALMALKYRKLKKMKPNEIKEAEDNVLKWAEYTSDALGRGRCGGHQGQGVY